MTGTTVHATMPSSDVETAAGNGKPAAAAADAGAAFVLESKGTWWHAGFHMTTATVGPALLTLPYALRGLGWWLGVAALTALAAVTFYCYLLVSRVLDHCEASGRRHIRFRELAADVLGSEWASYLVLIVQTAINAGVSIGSILLAADCLQIVYLHVAPHGHLKLYHFIIVVAVVLALLSQMPSLHSLRYINFGSLIVSIGYTMLVSAACIYAGWSSNAPPKDYSLSSSNSGRMFNAFLSISILASVFGNSILPEIQATLAPPASGKMAKALVLCYSVLSLTFYFPAITGYWAFGNQVRSNVLKSLMPDTGPWLAPTWLLILAVVLVLLQLIAIALVYSQVAYEIIETKSADAARGRFSRRNLVPRVALRTAYVAGCAFVAAMLPFFGEIIAVVGAVGYIPLDVVIPVAMYNMALARRIRRSPAYLANVAIMVVFIGLGVIGAVASVRKLVLNADRFKLFSNGLS
ncbi:putative GABA transporter 2 [Dichanthelium oligosanthes]|uniref:Putative GABA transporter 2 n=1 Tax=Dichanthelium oligosanthes TaxID=888268 RepID=A0A1E5VFV0_9POAL|nr:putative GABA transporter 2 [Dichanthelium oligosanthes]